MFSTGEVTVHGTEFYAGAFESERFELMAIEAPVASDIKTRPDLGEMITDQGKPIPSM